MSLNEANTVLHGSLRNENMRIPNTGPVHENSYIQHILWLHVSELAYPSHFFDNM